MILDPILTAPTAVQIHAVAAIEALALTPVVLLRKRRDRWHRLAGYAWTANMALAALSSFWIMEIRLVGPFSPIHALSVLTLINLVLAIRAIRRRDVARHEGIMRATAFWALGVAGAFTLLPGRRMHAILFGPASGEGPDIAAPVSIGVILAALLFHAWRLRRVRPVAPAE